MAMKPKESDSLEGKDGTHYSITKEATEQSVQLVYTRRAPLTDEVSALALKVFLKFDFILVLPLLTMFCECQYEFFDYRHELTLYCIS
jgi:hypothetical protein